MPGPAKPWKAGQSGNPAGRPLGSRHRITEAFIGALADDFAAHGVRAIETVRADDPSTYLRLVASLMPKELHLSKDNPLDTYSDAELAALLATAAGIEDQGGLVIDGDPLMLPVPLPIQVIKGQ